MPTSSSGIRLTKTWTDGSGGFRLPDLPGGEYALVFFHERLSFLGISSGSHTVRVEPGLTTSRGPGRKGRTAPLARSAAWALAMGGRMISRQDIERVLPRSRDVADLLHHSRYPASS